jgi:threonine aldolase
MSSIIDLRSDTVTLPSPEMRRAMYEAELGDDVFGDDPTVNRLQEKAADLVGTEDTLFVPSGTMGNLLAVMSHCQRGDEVLFGDQAHMFLYEAGGSSVLGGTMSRSVPTAPDGTLSVDALRAAVRNPRDVHQPRTALICLENTHNRRGGAVLSPEYMSQVRTLADEIGVPLHLDGARVFNAAVHLGLPVREIARTATTLSFCFSKGLGAPVGSILCGPRPFIERAHRWRKMVGGGMRQAGVLAAAGIYALDHMVERLADDHDNARALAEGLAAIPGIRIAQAAVQTNMVFADIAGTGLDAERFGAQLKEAGVLCVGVGSAMVRFVTHYGIERADIDQALARSQQALGRVAVTA